MGNVIGSLVVYGGGRWEWVIPEFVKLRRWRDACYWSRWFDAEGMRWNLQIYPNGTMGNEQVLIALRKISSHGRSLICTVGLKRAGHSGETIVGTEPCGGIVDPSFVFNGTRGELENGGWLIDGRLTVTLLFRAAHAPQEHNICMPLDIKTEHSKSAIEQDSRWDVSKPLEAKANIKVTSRQTQTDVLDVKNERLEDGTCTGAEGVMQLSENLKGLLTEQNEDFDVTILVKGKEFRAHSLILKARCPVLLGMMLEHDSKEKNSSGTIRIEDCDPECFDEFLIFVYCGRAENLTTSKAISLYYAADEYDLPLLKKQCVQFLEASLTAASVCDAVQLATQNGEKKLLRTATEYFAKNLKTILSTTEWQNFLAQNPTVANELYVKSLQNL